MNSKVSTILIVDDSPEEIKLLSSLLRAYKKKAALNGDDAIKISKSKNPPDLILMDVLMPEQSGYQVCEELSKHPQTKDIPVIFISAKNDKEDLLRGFEAGGKDYITKPYDSRELLKRINTQLEISTKNEQSRLINQILEKKVQERTLQLQKANKELKVLAQAKNNFLLMISHELRTPLNGIVAATQFLEELQIDNHEFRDYMEVLSISVDRLEHFSITALTITQLQTNTCQLNMEKISVDELIDESLVVVNRNLPKRNLKINKQLCSPNEILADYELMLRVFVSVLDNAIKFSPEFKDIYIRTNHEEGKFICKFEDQGVGFNQAALDSLFVPFSHHESHADNSLGLSLRAAQLIMEAHNGSIKIENTPNGGALVSLIFIEK
ncbi:MAG: hybrid sensor histidine kinase/response regulator [Bacteroidales bacterium]|nr:hybrid sensor histidine kinase/response regulator [Bacteroidales bacterium]